MTNLTDSGETPAQTTLSTQTTLSVQMKELVPVQVIHNDEHVLVLQTQAYAIETDDNVDTADKGLTNPTADAMLETGKASYGEFNLGLHVSDEPTKVFANRCHLMTTIDKLSINDDEMSEQASQQANQHTKNCHTIHWLNQVHGNKVMNVDALVTNPPMTPPEADAQITSHQGQALAIMTADCVPIMLYCQETGQVAGVHAGWHGLANGVVAETIKAFETTDNSSIQAWIGACISGQNYEVNRDVVEKIVSGTMTNIVTNFVTADDKSRTGTGVAILDAESLQEQICLPHDDPAKTWLDIPMLARIQLAYLGVTVMTEDIPCSYANTQYYSHRRATHKKQKSTGRMAMVIMKK